MCNLCGSLEEQKTGREFERHKAEQLRRMAAYLDNLANGSLKPHSDDMKKVVSLGRSIIRLLVEDFV